MTQKVKSQADKRRYETFRDQHGRFWGANIEIETGDPCEVLSPQGWTAPSEPSWAKGLFMPPEDVVKMVPRAERAKKGYQVFVNYSLWLEKWDTRDIDYHKKMADYARGMNKTGAVNIAGLLKNPTPDLLRQVGQPPFPPREFIQAMSANNKWVLGQSTAIPNSPKLHALLELIRPQITLKRERAQLGVDPFEDGTEDEGELVGALSVAADPFAEVVADHAADLEEQYDHTASGGKRVAVKPPVKAVTAAGGKAKSKAGKEE